MATEIGNLGVRITADAESFKRDLEKASSKVKSFGDKMATLGKVAVPTMLALGAAAWKTTEAYGKQLGAELQLANAFKATGNALDVEKFKAFAAQIQATTRFADEDVIAMGALASTFGMTQDAVQGLMPSITDLATARMGGDLKGATELVGKAFSGQVQSLQRYGIFLTDAQKKVLEFGTEQEKVAVLTDALSSRFGGSAETATKTAAGAFDQLRNALGDTSEEMGKIIDAPLASLFRTMTTAIKGMPVALQAVIGGFVGLGAGVGDLFSKLWPLLAFGPQLKASFAGVGAFITGSMLPVLGVILAIAAAASAVLFAVAAIKRVREGRNENTGASPLDGLGDEIKASFVEGVSYVADPIKEAFVSAAESFGPGAKAEDVVATGSGGFGGGGGKAKKVANAWENFGDEWNDGAAFASAVNDQQIEEFEGALARFHEQRMRDIDFQAKLDEQVMLANAQRSEGLKATLAGIGDQVLGAMGGAGKAIKAAMQGFEQGGPMGAIASFFASVAMDSEAFQGAMQIAGDLFAELVAAIEPILSALQPLLSTVGLLAGWLIDLLLPVFKGFGEIVQFVGRAIAGVGWVIAAVVLAIQTIWNKIVDALLWAVRQIDRIPGVNMNGTIRALQRMQFDTDATADLMEELGDIAGGAAEGLGDVAEATRDATEQILNAPSGFKVALARYNAAVGEPRVGNGTAPGDTGAGGNTTINVDTIHVNASNPAELAEQLTRIGEINQFNRTGSITDSGSRSRVVP